MHAHAIEAGLADPRPGTAGNGLIIHEITAVPWVRTGEDHQMVRPAVGHRSRRDRPRQRGDDQVAQHPAGDRSRADRGGWVGSVTVPGRVVTLIRSK